jgi:predicted DNA-binding transcriptional regulator AlpA
MIDMTGIDHRFVESGLDRPRAARVADATAPAADGDGSTAPTPGEPGPPPRPPTLIERVSRLVDAVERLVQILDRQAAGRPDRDLAQRLALRADEVAELIGLSRRAFDRARASGEVPKPSKVIGKVPVWAVEVLRDWLQGRSAK